LNLQRENSCKENKLQLESTKLKLKLELEK